MFQVSKIFLFRKNIQLIANQSPSKFKSRPEATPKQSLKSAKNMVSLAPHKFVVKKIKQREVHYFYEASLAQETWSDNLDQIIILPPKSYKNGCFEQVISFSKGSSSWSFFFLWCTMATLR